MSFRSLCNGMMIDYVESVFDIMSNPLDFVEVRFPQVPVSPIQISFIRLRDFMMGLLSDIKHYINIFRPFLPKETIARFEDRLVPGWMRELLMVW